jgi:hypothetical protein
MNSTIKRNVKVTAVFTVDAGKASRWGQHVGTDEVRAEAGLVLGRVVAQNAHQGAESVEITDVSEVTESETITLSREELDALIASACADAAEAAKAPEGTFSA